MDLFILLLLVAAFLAFVVDAVRTRGSLIAIGLACWVLTEVIAHWPS
jgi:hypothetical protein